MRAAIASLIEILGGSVQLSSTWPCVQHGIVCGSMMSMVCSPQICGLVYSMAWFAAAYYQWCAVV
eukprot:1153308-Pelagomonas_calceolata.AAC.1